MHRRGFNVSLKICAAQPTKNAFPFEGKVSAKPTDEVKFKSVRLRTHSYRLFTCRGFLRAFDTGTPQLMYPQAR